MLARNFLLCAAFTLHNGFLTPVMKGEIGIAVSLIYLCTLLHVKPFVVRNMNRVEALFVNTEIIIVLFGILFSSDEQFSNSAFLEALQLVFLFGVYLLAALMMNLHFWGMLYEKYGKFWWCRVALRDSTESTETLIDSIWTADDEVTCHRGAAQPAYNHDLQWKLCECDPKLLEANLRDSWLYHQRIEVSSFFSDERLSRGPPFLSGRMVRDMVEIETTKTYDNVQRMAEKKAARHKKIIDSGCKAVREESGGDEVPRDVGGMRRLRNLWSSLT